MIFLLDTNTFSHLMQEDSTVDARLKECAAQDGVIICPVVRGEILFGIFPAEISKLSRRQREDLRQRHQVLQRKGHRRMSEVTPKKKKVKTARRANQVVKRGKTNLERLNAIVARRADY